MAIPTTTIETRTIPIDDSDPKTKPKMMLVQSTRRPDLGVFQTHPIESKTIPDTVRESRRNNTSAKATEEICEKVHRIKSETVKEPTKIAITWMMMDTAMMVTTTRNRNLWTPTLPRMTMAQTH